MGVAYQEKVISDGLISDLFCYTFVIFFFFLARNLFKGGIS